MNLVGQQTDAMSVKSVKFKLDFVAAPVRHWNRELITTSIMVSH